MNVKFDRFNTNDVAQILKVSGSAVASWCRKGWIIAENISNGTDKARWMIEDKEVDRIKGLMKKYGKVKWYHHRHEGLVHPEDVGIFIEEQPIEVEEVSSGNVVMDNVNKIADIVYKIADLRDELENLEARKAQIENEINDYKKQVNDLL